MSNPKRPSAAEQTESSDPSEIRREDFQFVLKHLMAAYQPILEEDLKRAKAPEQLKQAAAGSPQSREDELTLAHRIFDKFFIEEVALRLLPEAGRKQLGPVENWRGCLEQIRCSIIFGWLVCRGPRTFRAFVYYVYEYWRCIRESLGTPVSSPPTEEQRKDFQVLAEALAKAYKPYLTDQLASVEFPAGIPNEVLAGKINSAEGQENICAIFERLLTTDAAQALLGKQAFAESSKDPSFGICRCWCLCAICFGCCLASARSLDEAYRCLASFFRALENCFQPLTCAITNLTAGECATETYYSGPGVLGIEIEGTAAGAQCAYYTIEWKDPAAPPAAYTQTGITYATPAPPAGPGTCGKVSTVLGYLDTFSIPVGTDVEIRLTVFSTTGATCVQEVSFQIFKQRVSIEAVAGVSVQTPPGWPDPNAQLVNPATGYVASFGSGVQIWGHAWVGTCANKNIKNLTLSYKSGFVTDPTVGPWTQFWEIDYNSVLQQAQIQTGYFDLTSFWQFVQICWFGPCPPNPLLQYDQLNPASWISGVTPPAVPPGQFFPIDPQAAPIWASQSLPAANCYSGQYTLLLTVTDTMGNKYYDTQQVWFDNKAIYGEISGLLGVAPCAVINLSQILGAGNCNIPWLLSIQGLAYDEYILEGTTTHPSDNFGGYCLTVTRQGGSQSDCTPVLLSVPLPVPSPTSPATIGTQRVGDPGTRCFDAAPPPSGPITKSFNTLTTMDARMFDATCASSAQPAPPAGFALNRANPATNTPAQCCSFYFSLNVWDTTIIPGGTHSIPTFIWPIYICNDLPPA